MSTVSQSHPDVTLKGAIGETEVAVAWRELERAAAHISFQDVRLVAGEGKLSASDVLLAVNVILRRRFDDGAARLGGRGGNA